MQKKATLYSLKRTVKKKRIDRAKSNDMDNGKGMVNVATRDKSLTLETHGKCMGGCD